MLTPKQRIGVAYYIRVPKSRKYMEQRRQTMCSARFKQYR